MDRPPRFIYRLSWITAVLAVVVVALGAFTRLSDAGLGCPDWPGCYGQLTVVGAQKHLSEVQQAFPTKPLIAHKAWAEMIHRYFAGSLAVLSLLLGIFSFRFARKTRKKVLMWVSLLLLVVLLAQPLLGMWTVTLQLWPAVVSLHLLFGMAFLALLWVHVWLYRPNQAESVILTSHSVRYLLRGGIFLIFLQLALGAWTSTNYAAIACDSFPICQLATWHWDFTNAFHLLSPIGLNYDGGLLPLAAKQTIQMVHRLGALLVFSYVLLLSVFLLRQFYRENEVVTRIGLLWLALFVQLCLGVANVELARPLWVAILHNLGAASVLLSMIWLNLLIKAPQLRQLKEVTV